MPESGQLEKVTIYAYNNPDLSKEHQVGNPFVVMMNPESFTLDFKMEFNPSQGQGTSASLPRFAYKPPEEMSFEFLFDNTGIVDGKPVDSNELAQKIEDFREFLMGYDGESHEPKFFKLVWGTSLFAGRCTALSIVYKLFAPDGKPIRAISKVTLKEFKEDNVRVREENAHSPDLTHYRIIKKGETLPWLCYLVYGDSKYYVQVAEKNRLVNFRNLKIGDQLFFPPISKKVENNAQ